MISPLLTASSTGTVYPTTKKTRAVENKTSAIESAWSTIQQAYFANDTPDFNVKRPVARSISRATEVLIERFGADSQQFVPSLLASWKKSAVWFDSLIRLHFSGMETEAFDLENFGLDGENEMFGEHRLYREIINKLRECRGIRTKDDFFDFMHWLITLDIAGDFPSDELLQKMPDWMKSITPELCSDCPKDTEQEPYNPLLLTSPLSDYYVRIKTFKQHHLDPLLKYAPESFVTHFLEKISSQGSEEEKNIWQWLFRQECFPLNMHFREYCPWSVLLSALPKVMPDPVSDIARQFLSTPEVEESVTHGLEHKAEILTCQELFGRTLTKIENGKRHYFKVQSATESDEAFKRGFDRLKKYPDLKQQLNLESFPVTPIQLHHIDDPDSFLEHVDLSFEDKCALGKRMSGKPCHVMEFTTPESVLYQKYVYDLDNPDEIKKALGIYARDFGRLWRHGLLGPVALSAFHDVEQGRRHVMLTPFIDVKCEGSLEQWNFTASNYPNVGSAGMGMRDKVDIGSAREQSPHHFSEVYLNLDNQTDLNKISQESLAKAAQNIVLLYGRCFQGSFNYHDPQCLSQINEDLKSLLTDLFSNAFNLEPDCVSALLTEDGLLDQCVREVCYWLDKKAPYVDDLRKRKINRTIYPHLPEAMQCCELTGDQKEFLTDIGFHDPERDDEGECQLGAGSGRMPLIALNAMVVKVMACGVTQMAKEKSQQTKMETEQMMQQASLVV